MNGDGKPDLVVANSSSDGTVSVLLGNGDGTFQPAMTYDSGCWAYSVAVADVNGDGKPDLVVANCSESGDGAAGVLLGNGDGTFQPVAAYDSGGVLAHGAAVADVNGDGKPDIIVANWWSSLGGVLLGNGDGTFQAAVTYGSGGGYATAVAVGDVNLDGKLDLVIANCSTPTGNSCPSREMAVGVLLGNGNGTFQSATGFDSAARAPTSIAVADFNGDGWPDIVVAAFASNSSRGTVVVLINDSSPATATALA